MYKKFVLCISSICFLACTSLGQNWVWAASGVGTGTDEGYSVATDAAGNVYLTGYFNSPTITFGAYTLTNVGVGDVYLVKYDPSGNVLWAKSVGGPSDERSYLVRVDKSGNVLITGFFQSNTLTVGTTTLTSAGGPEVFLIKFDPNGNILWAKSAGGSQEDLAYSVAMDANNNVYICGSFISPTITFGTITLNNNSGYLNLFLAKYDANGNVLWAKTALGTFYYEGFSIAADVAGNVYLTGYFQGAYITFGSTTLVNSGSGPDMYLAKYDANGNVLWAKQATGANSDMGNSLTIDLNGNILVSGSFQTGSATFGTTTLTSAGAMDGFLAKYDAQGNIIWIISCGGPAPDDIYSICTDRQGNAFIVGGFNRSSFVVLNSTSVPSVTLTPTPNATDPMFLAEYDSIGNLLCATVLGSGGDDNNGVAIDIHGNIFVGGDFAMHSFYVGNNLLTLGGSTGTTENAFVAKYSFFNFSRDTTVCPSSSTLLDAGVATSYTWSTGVNTQTITANDTGTYWVQIQPIAGCRMTDTIHVKFINPPQINVLKDTSVCSNVNYVLDASAANANSYSWSTGSLNSFITPTVSNVYWVDMQTSLSPCLIRDSATIFIVNPPSVTAINYTVCSGQLTTITPTVTGGSGVYNYNWGTAFSGATYTTTILTDSVYTFAVTDLNGCVTPNDTGKIKVINAGTNNFPAPAIGCKPVCLNLNLIPYNTLANWQWQFGNGDTSTQAKTIYCYSDSGSYKVSLTYTTNLGCKNKVSADSLVRVYANPTAAFSASTFTTDVLNGEINFYNESVNYVPPVQWTFGDTGKSTIKDPTHNYTTAGNYNVILVVQNQKGCLDTAMHELVVNEIFTFYAPNAFTPNYDGNDETFLPVGTGWDNNTFKLLIYDRWGNVILSTTNPNQGWDGNMKGHHAQEDVYVWKVEVSEISSSRPHTYSGTITLVK